MIKLHRKTLVIVTGMIIAIGVGAFMVMHVRSSSILGKPFTTTSVHQCSSDAGRKCFDMKGEAYVVDVSDTEKIGNELESIVTRNKLTANTEFTPISGKALNDKAQAPDSTTNGDLRIAGTVIALYYGGGLFGQYSFPYSSDGHALYVSMYAVDSEHNDSDSIYIIESDTGANDTQARVILKKAKELALNKYILVIAQR